jgi:hypothetical protein
MEARKRKSVAGKLFNFRLSPAERKAIGKKARKYTRGNLSAWIKYAALSHDVPKKKGSGRAA